MKKASLTVESEHSMACWQANMQAIFSRFPHIGEEIMDQVDNAHLTECRVVNRFWRRFIDNQKLLWMRIIYEKGLFTREWEETSRQTS